MSFQNIYFKRATATPRACYVCSKPTATCLATTNAIDFIYTCDAHLSDPGFAAEIIDPNAAQKEEVAMSKEEIARVKAEWEAKEALKKEKKEKAKATGEKSGTAEGTGEKKDDDKKKRKKDDKSPSPSPPGAFSPGAATPTHKRYSLHRDFYAMRQAEHRRKRQTKQMNELAPRLPGAPRGSLAG